MSLLPDVIADSQIAHRGLLCETASPVNGERLLTDTPFKISGELTGADRPFPAGRRGYRQRVSGIGISVDGDFGLSREVDPLIQLDARVEEAVRYVGDEVRQHDKDAEHQNTGLDHGMAC